MSKRTSPGKKKRKVSTDKRTSTSRKDAAAKRRALAKRAMDETSQPEAETEAKTDESGDPPAKFQTAAVPVKKTAVKRAAPAKKTPIKKAASKKNSFEVINKSEAPESKSAKTKSTTPEASVPKNPAPNSKPEPEVIKPAASDRPKSSVRLRKETMRVSLKAPSARDASDPVPPPADDTEKAPPAAKSSVPLRKETMRVSLKAPSAGDPPSHATEPVAPEATVTPEEEAYQPKPKKSVKVRKETIRVSLKAPAADEVDPMENWDILEPGKLSEAAKEDPNRKYAPPGLQDTPAAGLDQVIDPAPTPEPAPQPQPEEAPLSLDQALPLRKETMRVSVKAPFAGMAAAQAAAAREPILTTRPAVPEPEPAPAVVLEQSTASVTVSAPQPQLQAQAPQQPQPQQLNTPLVPQPIQPKKDLGSILMTWVCIILGIIAAVMIYLAFFT